MKQSFGQKFMETGAAFIRSAREAFAPAARPESSSAGPAETAPGSHDSSAEQHDDDHHSGEASSGEDVLTQPAQVVVPFVQDATTPISSAATTGTQREEVAELRAYLLSQQQDIARLTEQVQELKSLVISQRQVLVYLGKEMEAGSMSRMTGSIASAVAKRSRPVRQKPAVKTSEIKEKAVAQDHDPIQSSLNV